MLTAGRGPDFTTPRRGKNRIVAKLQLVLRDCRCGRSVPPRLTLEFSRLNLPVLTKQSPWTPYKSAVSENEFGEITR
jgi:hypothetical protein